MNPEPPKNRNRRWIAPLACLIVLAPLGYLLSVWNRLPDRIPMQYGLDLKTVNRYGDRNELFLLVIILGVVGAGVMLLFQFLPRIDPKKNLSRSAKALQMIGLGTCLLLAVVGISVIRMAEMGNPRQVMELIPFAVLGLMALLGNYMTSLKPNYFAGFRTPWALENEVVWRKTHRRGGKLMFWGSLVALLPVALVPGEVAKMLVAVSFLMGVTLYTFYYSYRVYREEQTKPTQTV